MVDSLSRQFRTVIQWENPPPDVLFYQWTKDGDEIKNASKVIVGPGQQCLFIYEGEIRAEIAEESMLTLETDNVPFWTTIANFMQKFESHHKVGIFFCRTTVFPNQKWGTSSPVTYIDPVYDIPVNLRAYGNYSFRIKESGDFFSTFVGGRSVYRVRDFQDFMSDRLVDPLSEIFAEERPSFGEVDALREEIGAKAKKRLVADFKKLGLVLTDFRIEGAKFDEITMQRVERILDKKLDAKLAEMDKDAQSDAAEPQDSRPGLGIRIKVDPSTLDDLKLGDRE